MAIGMIAEARISNKLGTLDSSEVDTLKTVIEQARLPTEIPGLESGQLIGAMKHDKKILRGKIRFVLLRSIGEVFITDEVSTSLIKQVLAE